MRYCIFCNNQLEFRPRNTLVTSNGKAAIYTTLGGHTIGDVVSTGLHVCINVRISCADTICEVCLTRNGELRDWFEVGSRSATLELIDEQA